MEDTNYELMPLDEIKKLKEEISELRKEKHYAPSNVVAKSLDRLANCLENLFKIFDVAATDLEQETINKKSFEEQITPILDKLSAIEEQNKDIAEGMLALADIVKKLEENNEKEKIIPYGKSNQVNTPIPKPIESNSNIEQPFSTPKPLNEIPPLPKSGIPPPIPKPIPK